LPAARQPVFRAFSAEQLAFVERFKIGELMLDADTNLLLEGAHSPHLYTILRGWVYRHKSLSDGRRQVLNFGLPGDFVGLQMSVLGEMEHTVTAMSEVTLCVFDRQRLWEVFRDYPDLSFALTWMAAREEQALDGHLLSVGRRTARERLAYLLLALYRRAEQVGLAGDNAMRTPFTQSHLADALGLTPVHVSRTLKRMEKEGLLAWNRPVLRLLDRPGLEIAAHEPPVVPDKRHFL
jgi:CRP/FNR family transcriptional regulator